MRPRNLKFPFTWNERKPLYHEGIFIVPHYFDMHDAFSEMQEIFSEKKPFCIEYCSGNGDWVIEKAKAESEVQWIAVEKKFERVQKIWSKMHNCNIENLTIVSGEAFLFTKHYLPQDSVKEVYINFPDPWPKERHAKHRLIQSPFVEELARVVQSGGKAQFATDHAAYSSQMIEAMQKHADWKCSLPAPHFVQDLGNYGSSWFQRLWEEKGRQFYYMEFERI